MQERIGNGEQGGADAATNANQEGKEKEKEETKTTSKEGQESKSQEAVQGRRQVQGWNGLGSGVAEGNEMGVQESQI